MADRRIPGKNAWKRPCPWSRTGWAWADPSGRCNCQQCEPPSRLSHIDEDKREPYKSAFAPDGGKRIEEGGAL